MCTHSHKHGLLWLRRPLGLVLTLAMPLHAQMHHVDAPEHVTRALGVYEWTGDLDKPTAARFVPVSLFINGSMQDAGLYLARPVPFALQTGNLYALERAGEPEGLLDLEFAQHVVASAASPDADASSSWYGYGKYTPQPAAKISPLRPSAHPPAVLANGKAAAEETGDGSRPHMTRRDAASSSPPATTGSTTDSASPQAGSPGTTGSAGGDTGSPAGKANDDDADRPTLRHRDPSQDATRKREYGSRSKQASVTAAGPGPGDDPDRPVLGRGGSAEGATPPLRGLPADMHQVIGVSDPVHRDDHNFARDWENGEERRQILDAMQATARTRSMAYLQANGLVASTNPLPDDGALQAPTPQPGITKGAAAPPNPEADDTGTPPTLQRGVPAQYRQPATSPDNAHSAEPATKAASPSSSSPSLASRPAVHSAAPATARQSPATRRSAPKAPTSLNFAKEHLTGYTLSYGGLPTFVYTAAASVAPAASPTAPPSSLAEARRAVYVTVVAQRLPSGELQTALTGVTDSAHLDRTPQLRLVGAADPDDSHRASLLFELRAASSRQFALYRLAAAQAEQTFTTASIE